MITFPPGIAGLADPWIPSDADFLAWTFDPVACSTGDAPALNTITLARINVRAARSCTSVAIAVTAAGVGLTTGENFVGLYVGQAVGTYTAGQLVGTSVDQTSAWGSTGVKAGTLAAGPVALPAAFYWAAILPNGGTAPSIARAANVSSSLSNLGMSAAYSRAATAGAGTVLAASITPSSLTQISSQRWAALE